MTLKGGICTQLPGQTALTCDLMTDTTPNSVGALAQSQLNTQLTTWRKDLNPLQVYPIFSFGVAYSIRAK
jgi:hypothetical protein